MPTEAVTGTKQLKTTSKSTTKVEHKAEKPDESKWVGEPLADPNGNGTIQATNADGSTINVDASEAGWQDMVRAQDPKHTSLKHEAK